MPILDTDIADRFVVRRDGRTISLSADRKKAEQIARHFRRLQPTATIIVEDLAGETGEQI
jgi:hypothetical protein